MDEVDVDASAGAALCPSRTELLAASEDGVLDERHGDHLATCATCRVRVTELRENASVFSALRDLGTSGRLQDDDEVGDAPAGYTLVREIHRGGQGVVYEAREHSPSRIVALKVPLHGRWVTANQRRRFEREIEVIAGLRHPNIVTLFARGTMSSGSDFFAMEYVEGQSLQELLDERAEPMPVDIALPMFITICEAVEYAHQVGVIHRDLKPSNIIVDADDEPHLLDFGMAKLTDESQLSGLTVSGQFVGSLIWAAPEQVWFTKGDGVSTRTDIYGLGLLLYRMVTGVHAYPIPSNPGQMIDTIGKVEPLRASRQLEREVIPHDLDAVLLKALEKRPSDRYQSVSDLVADCRAVRDGKDVSVASYSGIQRLRRSARRHPWLFAVVTGLLVLGVTLTLLGHRGRIELEQQRRLDTIARARDLVANGSPYRGFELLWNLANTESPSASWLGVEVSEYEQLRLRWALRELVGTFPLERSVDTGHGSALPLGLVVHPHGRVLLIYGVRGDWVEMRDVKTLEVLGRTSIDGASIRTVELSPSGEHIAIWSEIGGDLQVHAWDEAAWRAGDVVAENSLLQAESVYDIEWAPSGEVLIVETSTDGVTYLFDEHPAPFEEVRRVGSLPGVLTSLCVTETTIRGWESYYQRRHSLAPTLDRATGAVREGQARVAFSTPDDSLFFLTAPNHFIMFWPPKEGERESRAVRVSTQRRQARRFDVHPDLEYLALEMRRGGGVVVLQIGATEPVYDIAFHRSSLRGLAYSPAGDALFTLTADGRLQRFATAPLRSASRGFEQGACYSHHGVTYSDDGALIAVCGTAEEDRAGYIGVWDAETLRLVDEIVVETSGRSGVIPSVVFDPDDTDRLFAVTYAGALLEWDRDRGSTDVLYRHAAPLNDIEVDPSTRRLAMSASRWELLVWDLESGVLDATPVADIDPKRLGRMPAVAWRPDGVPVGVTLRGDVVSTYHDKVHVADTSFRDVVTTPDGAQLVIASDRGDVIVVDVVDEWGAFVLGQHESDVLSVAISPNGQLVASADSGGTVKVWHLASRHELASVAVSGTVLGMAFSPSGRGLTIGGSDQLTHWDFVQADETVNRVGAQIAAWPAEQRFVLPNH